MPNNRRNDYRSNFGNEFAVNQFINHRNSQPQPATMVALANGNLLFVQNANQNASDAQLYGTVLPQGGNAQILDDSTQEPNQLSITPTQ